MQPTQVMLNELATLLANDTATLAPATLPVKVHLIIASFVPSLTTDFTTLTEATFTGGSAKSAGTGAQQSFRDPVSGNLVIQLLEPAGGWHWAASANTLLPQTVYGYAVTDNAGAVTYGSNLFPAPVLISATGDGVDISEVRFFLSQESLF